MGPRGRGGGGFRGRGSRGRGRGGRGRGKATSRFGPSRRFDGARLAEADDGDSSDQESEDEAPSDDDLIADEDSADENDDSQENSSKPYLSLLQSLSEAAQQPSAKRRKLEHRNDAGSSSDVSEDDEEAEDIDQVDELEEIDGDPEDVDEDQVLDNESDDEPDDTDPFDSHFVQGDQASIYERKKSAKDGRWTTKRSLLQSWRTTYQVPETSLDPSPPRILSNLSGLKLKQKLKEASSKFSKLDSAQQAVGGMLFDYQDVMFCDRTVANSDRLRRLTCLHALNHVFKTRDRVIRNNYKLAKEEDNTELELRDQGFTRPKVLFILPTRNSCLQIANIITDLCEPDQQENRKRFDDSYTDKDSKFGNDRPADFKSLFEGNDDDMFRLGLKFTRKTIKYFAQFYNSDILFASPLGLRMAIGSEEDKKKVDYDFLSSIELVVLDQADALLMQNWDHIDYIFEHLNRQPKDAHGCDFSRVRSWYLDDQAKFYRQTVVLSAFATPELSELQRLHCHNWAGKARLQPEYAGVLQQLGVKSRQTFSRFQSSAVDKDPDARFEYFISAVVPSLVRKAKDSSGTLIFIPSYLDFVRVRNYFATSAAVSDVTFGAISEYTDVPAASRARSHFLNGRHRVLLYTERAHHFRRYQLSGVQRVVFYALPDNPVFYKEIAGGYLAKSEQDLKIEPGQGTVRVVFSKYDVMKLERVVGSKRVGKMIQDRGDTFDFV